MTTNASGYGSGSGSGQDSAQRAGAIHFEDLVRRLVDGVPAVLGSARSDLETHFKTILQQQLARLDLCSRQEFDAQERVLARAQERLAQLEARIAVLEARSHQP